MTRLMSSKTRFVVNAEGRKEATVSAASLAGTPLRNLTKCCTGCRTGVFGVSVHCLEGCVAFEQADRRRSYNGNG